MILSAIYYLSLAAAAVVAQNVVSTTGIQYTCPASPPAQAIQAFSTICPLSLTDGSANLNTKSITVTYRSAPTNYQTLLSGDVTIICIYGRQAPTNEGKQCVYFAGGGQDVRFGYGTTNSLCPAKTTMNGAAPRPSPGGNYRKRQTPSAVQSRQPNFVSERTQAGSGGIYLNREVYFYQPVEAGQPSDSLFCSYTDGANGNFGCNYVPTTGVPRTVAGAPDPRCATTACPSSQYVAQTRKRAIERRQVQAADIRGKAARAGEVDVPVRRRKVVKNRKSEGYGELRG